MTAGTIPAVPTTLYARVFKRLFDLVLSGSLVLILLPVMVVTGVAVLLFLGPPMLYLDERAGLGRRPIWIAKFRSMSQATDATGKPLSDALRLGGFGRFLRRTSLDELPQLFSVLGGDMSLIGPRPLPMRYVPRYNARQASRLLVRPGLTGLAQINGRNALGWPERLELDAQYVEVLGRATAPLADFWIAARTVVQILAQSFTGRGIAAPGAATMQEFVP